MNNIGHILLVDDQADERFLYNSILSDEGFGVTEAASAREAFQLLKKDDFDVVLCDVNLSDGHAVDHIVRFKELAPLAEVIMLTAFGRVQDGVRAMKLGAYDYLIKGEGNACLIPLMHRALERVAQRRSLHDTENPLGVENAFRQVIGKSAVITNLIEMSKRVAPTDTTVLLLGETGTGKEVFARAIHQASLRNQNPFVALNCSAFNRELLESELFGHKAGAFTGAAADKKGLFHVADGGTLFLDEIGEMHPDLQAKLLRVLENGSFLRVGDTRPCKVDVRIIAATNQTLLGEGTTFRADLYYRLSVFELSLPPLRDRKADIPELAEYFLQKLGKHRNRNIQRISPEFMEALMQYPWKGNVRELRNLIERSIILCESEQLDLDVLPPEIRLGSSASDWAIDNGQFDMASVERQHIARVLKLCRGNKTKAARLLNIGISTLYRKMADYGLEE